MDYELTNRDVERLRATIEKSKLIGKTKEEQELIKLDALRINHP
jgi:hypothetical protein